MAAKSITIAADAAHALAAITAYADRGGLASQMSSLQNGTRVRLQGAAPALGMNVYPSKGGGCKLVFDQPDDPRADEIAALLAGTPSAGKPPKSTRAAIEPVLEDVPAWIGSDESGKGDYFGPLVTAAVGVTRENWRVLHELGVQDSKNLGDARASAIARDITAAFPNEVVVILPPRYNELYQKFRNVNRLLAWAHARAVENVAEKTPEATAAVADQFGDESLIREALFRRGRELRLVQMPRAERDPAVAAASILARAEFLRRLDQLGRAAGVRLPKGASATVDATARTLVAAQGEAALSRYAKLHFKTTQRVLR